MAWSDAARRAALEARRRMRTMWSEERAIVAKAKSGNTKLLRSSMRSRLASNIRNYRAGKTQGGYGGGANSPRGWANMAAMSTRLRNHFRRRVDRARGGV